MPFSFIVAKRPSKAGSWGSKAFNTIAAVTLRDSRWVLVQKTAGAGTDLNLWG